MMYTVVWFDITNRITDGGLEDDPVYATFLNMTPNVLCGALERIVPALMEIDAGNPRHMMYGTVLRVIQQAFA